MNDLYLVIRSGLLAVVLQQLLRGWNSETMLEVNLIISKKATLKLMKPINVLHLGVQAVFRSMVNNVPNLYATDRSLYM